MIHTRTKIIVFVSVSLLLASLSAFGVFFYKLETQKAAYQTMRTVEAEQTARLASLSSLVETLENTKDDRAIIATRFLTEEDVIDLLSLIETLARETGALLSTDTLTVESLNAQFEYLAATISVEGGYAQVIQMLELLEHLPYETQVQNVNLERVQNEWRGVVNVRILKFKNV